MLGVHGLCANCGERTLGWVDVRGCCDLVLLCVDCKGIYGRFNQYWLIGLPISHILVGLVSVQVVHTAHKTKAWPKTKPRKKNWQLFASRS